MNFSEKDTFMRLTFAENIQDIIYADNKFLKIMKRFNYKYKRKSKFLAICEFQRCGAIHYHVLVNWQLPTELKKRSLRSLESELGTKNWGNGFVNLRSLKGQKKISPLIVWGLISLTILVSFYHFIINMEAKIKSLN